MASNFFNKASLVMVPDAPIDGKLPSVKPEDRSGDFTFSRGSNLAATRVNKDGLIEKGRENLLLQSNQFDTTWLNASTTEVGGQAGYDGSNDAWLLTKNAGGGYIYQNKSQSGVITLSIYAKAKDSDYLLFICDGGSYQRFNLSNGALGNGTAIDAKIASVGNGWYRCSMLETASITRVRIFPCEENSTSATSGSIYIQDAQLEQGLVATEYIETTTATVQKGILENLPRLNYSGGATCPSLLLEPQRSNLFAHSEYLSDGSGWADYSTTITPNNSVSPEGVQNATNMIIEDTQSRLQFNASQGAGTYTFSVYARSDSPVGMRLRPSVDGTYDAFYFTTTSEWKRYHITFTATTSVGLCQIRSYQEASGNIEIYGFQLEQGSYPTSYIPTYGTSQTRSGDNTGTIDVSSLGVTTGYTLFYELGDFNVALGGVWLAQSGGNDRPYQVFGATAVIKTTSGDVYPFNHGTSGKGTGIKVAVNYDGTNINVFTNGTKRGTWAANKTLWDSLTDLDMNLSSVQMVNWKQLLVFPTALTDDECIALTTI